MAKQRIDELRAECVREIIDISNHAYCKMLVRNDELLRNHGDYRLLSHERLTYKSDASDLKVLYKYMNFHSFELFLRYGFHFVEPCVWPDKYESKFYRRSTDGIIDNRYPDAEYADAPYLYACCMSTSQETESAWKMYRGGGILGQKCVKLVIAVNGLFDLLDKYAEINESKVYCGAVTYAYPEYDIDCFYTSKKNRYLWFYNFSLLNYLSLLLVKRQPFMTENEVRFFVVPEDCSKTRNNSINVGCTPTLNSVVTGVLLDPWCNNEDVHHIKKLCEDHGLMCFVSESKLFDERDTSESVFLTDNIINPWE